MEYEQPLNSYQDPVRQKALGSTALEFIAPAVPVLSSEEQIIYVIDDPEFSEAAVVPYEDLKPSYAANREDFQLLRRSLRSAHNRRRRNRR